MSVSLIRDIWKNIENTVDDEESQYSCMSGILNDIKNHDIVDIDELDELYGESTVLDRVLDSFLDNIEDQNDDDDLLDFDDEDY